MTNSRGGFKGWTGFLLFTIGERGSSSPSGIPARSGAAAHSFIAASHSCFVITPFVDSGLLINRASRSSAPSNSCSNGF